MTEPGAIDTGIRTLGTPKLTSRLPYRTWVDDVRLPIQVDRELCDEFADPVRLTSRPPAPGKKLYFDPSRAKCAIVTCGGFARELNDVIRAIVMGGAPRLPCALHHGHTLRAGRFHPGLRASARGVDPRTRGRHPPLRRHHPGLVTRAPVRGRKIVDSLERSNVSILFVIGGDGSMKAALSISREVQARNLKIAVIGIPKTIDNDINFIPQSFGFETAVFKATEAIECAHTEAKGMPNGIGLVKLMGRESGFIAAQATLAMKEVNFVLIPEAPFTLEGGRRPAARAGGTPEKPPPCRHRGGRRAGQHLLDRSGATDASGNLLLGDVADLLRSEIKRYMDARGIPHALKYIDPSYIIRSVPATANDKVYCGFLGQYAVHAAMAGRTDMVVGKIQDRYVHLPLELVTRRRRKLNIYSDLWRAALESTGQGMLAGMLPRQETHG